MHPPANETGLYGRLYASLANSWRLKARPEQLAPTGSWNIWLVLAGRGWGKTRTGTEWVQEQAMSSRAGRIALVAPTAADARDIIVEGPSGLLAIAPSHARPLYEPSKRRLTWPNGATATTFSAEEADRLRGPEHDAALCDELAAWSDPAAWDMLQFGLRIGHPRCVVTTTPRPVRLIRQLLNRPDVVVTRGRTMDNAENLSAIFLDSITGKYGGTRLGRQELDGELLEDVPGALWQRANIDQHRVDQAPDLIRIVVAIDPAVSTTQDSDETGIVAAGIDSAGHVYVLADHSCRLAPADWARRAVAVYRSLDADRIVAEKNQGGLMVEETIRTVDRNVAFKAVHASRGKVLRAEPVSALYEQGKVHHVGNFSTLEDQLCAFTSDFSRAAAGYSPDRVDALVYAITELAVKAQTPAAASLPMYVVQPKGWKQFSNEYWAARGYFHPHDRQKWIDKGVLTAEGKPKLYRDGTPILERAQ